MKKRDFHGACGTKAYVAWSSMRNRCKNPKNPAYENYGGRGITVCDRWETFQNFLDDMGHPEQGLTIDRIDNDKGYSPDNCRWESRKVQSRNRRGRNILTVNGQEKMLCEWSEISGINYCTILNRIKLGWSETEAVTTPLIKFRAGIKRGCRVKDFQPI